MKTRCQNLSVLLLIVLFAGATATGCVGKKKYDAVVQDREDLKVELAKTKKSASETEAELKARIDALKERIAQLEDRISELETTKADLQTKIEELNGTLKMYESEHGTLEERLEATKGELAELREEQREQEERLERYRSLARRLAETFESGQLSVKVRDGKMVIEMSDDVLFDSGRASINENGKKVLQQLATVLQDLNDREFLVAGHTDDVPISSARFQDNWELSTARSTNVVRYLAEEGVPPETLAAAGYSKYDPIASNKSEKGRAKNRRIEIILMPKLEELPELPSDIVEGSQ
jgi:chemotaxis protein MotB